MKKGFTLIELLAVIVILAVIALIATPIILNIIEDTRMESKRRSIDNYAHALETEIARKQLTEVNVTIDDAIESMQYNGSRVSCKTRRILKSGEIYLDNCSVDGEVVENYSYGERKHATTPMILTGETANNKISGYTLDKTGNIGLDIYAKVSGASHITYSINGETAVSVNPKEDKEGNTYYTVPVAAPYMSKSIIIKLYSGNTEVDTLTTSIKDYCNTILSNSEYSDSHDFIKAVVTFGSQAQQIFNIDTSNLADSMLSTPVDLSTLNIDLNYYRQFQFKTRLNAIDGLSFTATVTTDAIPKMSIYYELANSLNINDFIFTYEGKTLTATEGSDAYGTYYLVTIPIDYTNIIDEPKVAVTKGNQTETDIMSPAGYALAIIDRGYPESDMCASMIYYYQEANNYYY